MSRGPECTAVLPLFSQRMIQQISSSPPNIRPAMDRRGRCRDVSPMALARKANEEAVRPRTAPSMLPQPNSPSYLSPHDASPPTKPRTRRSPDTHTNTPVQAVASSSRLPPAPLSASSSPIVASDLPPSRTHSSSTIDSLSSEPTPPGPLTPPDFSDAYHKVYDLHSATMDDYERLPSPPRSLRDRMQIAYALEDMHLAKVLYLKLQGVEVTSDNDPRIAAVKDEDFSSSFVPTGTLQLDESIAHRCREGEKRERERRKRARREARLRACERKWEASVAWLREENAKVARRKEEEAMQRRNMSREAREREREREARERELETLRHTRHVRVSALTLRPLVDYSTLSRERSGKPESPLATDEDPLQYSFLPCNDVPRHISSSSTSPTPNRNILSLQRFQEEFARNLTRSVRFADVVASMHGPLFPPEDSPALRPQAKTSRLQRDLFDSLFDSSDREDEHALAKGNGQESGRPKQNAQRSETGSLGTEPASSIPSRTSAISSSVTTITRSNSWFSFGSRSPASTALTTPSSSLPSLKSPSQSLSPILSSSHLHTAPGSLRHSYRHPVLIPVLPAEDPLCPLTSISTKLHDPREEPLPSRGRPRLRGRSSVAVEGESYTVENGLVKRVGRSVSTLMDMATQFQRAYVKATLFSMGTDYSRSRSDSRDRSGSRSPSQSTWRTRHASSPRPPGRLGKLRPEGYRALAFDIGVLLSVMVDDELLDLPQPTRTLIPLALRLPMASSAFPQHGRVFPAPAQPPRSPFRIAQLHSGTHSQPRLRPVANPVLLRLHALQNICAVRALAWEGRAQEGRMCAGTEKLVGVAWEGIGRSRLGWEVTAVVC